MKASLTALAKSRQNNAEEFRGQQPQARSSSLAHCSIINGTLDLKSSLFKRRTKVAAMWAAPKPSNCNKVIFILLRAYCLPTSVVPHLQNTEYPVMYQEAFPAVLEMLFSPSYNQFCVLFLDTNGISYTKNHYAHQGSFNDFLGNVKSQLWGRRNNMKLRRNLLTPDMTWS